MLVDSLTQPHERRVSIEIDEMACKALLLWMQSRHKFFGEVDFGGVSMKDEDWKAFFREDEEESKDEDSDDESSEETFGKGIDIDGRKISEDTALMKDDKSVKATGPPVLANSLINFVIARTLAKSRAASRLVRTMAGDSRNLQQTWLDCSSTPCCLHVF